MISICMLTYYPQKVREMEARRFETFTEDYAMFKGLLDRVRGDLVRSRSKYGIRSQSNTA